MFSSVCLSVCVSIKCVYAQGDCLMSTFLHSFSIIASLLELALSFFFHVSLMLFDCWFVRPVALNHKRAGGSHTGAERLEFYSKPAGLGPGCGS